MIRQLITTAIAVGIASTVSAQDKPEAAAVESAAVEPAKPSIDPSEVKGASSYALGYRAGATFGQQFSRFGLKASDIDQEAFIKAFMTAFDMKDPELSEEKLQAAMMAFGENLQAREKQIAETNLAEGKKFLEENGKREGVVTTDSGLQYEVLTKGGEEKYAAPKEGEEAPEKQFQVNYKGTLMDGTQFDASPEGETVPMTLQVVPGFKEALTTMPVGAKWKLFLSPDLAYGEQRRSAEIGPNSVLVFELELVKIEDAPARPSMPFQMPGQ